MRVVFVTSLPWVKTLGAARLQVEMSEALADLGLEVTHLSAETAPPLIEPQGATSLLLPNRFARRAARRIRRVAHRFDVVDAHQGALPYTSQELGGVRVVVARSAGIVDTYDAWARFELTRWPASRAHPLTRPLRTVKAQQESKRATRAYLRADAVVVVNRDEREIVSARRPPGDVILMPSALPDAHLAAIASRSGDPCQRRGKPVVVFIGAWSRRKGSEDMAEIVRHVRRRVPGVRFRFVGTHISDHQLLTGLVLPQSGLPDWLEHVPRFEPDEMPDLLSDATLNILPSYVEGYPIAPIEAAAAGVPTVAYDAIGARELPMRLGPGWVTPCGVPQDFADVVAQRLGADQIEHAAVAMKARSIAGEHALSVQAPQLLAHYERLCGRHR